MAKKTNLLGNLNLKALDTINKQEESVNTDLIFSHFNFEFEMEENELDFLKNQTIKLQSTTSKAYTEIGKILSETRERLSNNKTGIFEKWFTKMLVEFPYQISWVVPKKDDKMIRFAHVNKVVLTDYF